MKNHAVAAALLLVACKQASPEAVKPEPVQPAEKPASGWASDQDELTLVNLYDSFGEANEELTQDFGFSTIVRYRGKTILFDSGTSADVFAKNLAAMGISPREIDYAVASHNHHDHIAGFDYLLRENPNVKLFLPNDFNGIGAPMGFSLAGPEPEAGKKLPAEQCYFNCEKTQIVIESSGRFWGANVTYVKEPTEILEGLRIVPTSSALLGTFMRYPPHQDEPKLVGMPELSVSIETEKGDVVLVGCSHASVEVIVEAVKAAGREIHLVVGGYHLLPYSREAIEKTARRLRDELGVEAVAPAHCTGHVAFEVFRAVYGAGYRFFGLGTKLVV